MTSNQYKERLLKIRDTIGNNQCADCGCTGQAILQSFRLAQDVHLIFITPLQDVVYSLKCLKY